MRVQTRTPRLERLRAAVQALTDAGRPHAAAAQDEHPLLRLDASLCVLCRRCLHVCEDVQGAFVYGVTGRGADARLALGSDDRFETSPCTSCGRCVEVCPTGALSDRDGPPLSGTRMTRSTCGYCGVGCQVEIESDPRGVRRISGAYEASVNRGQLCAKGRYAHDWRESPDRLTRPLLRVNGRLEPVSWSEAISYAALRLAEIHAQSGPHALAALTSSRSTNEAAYLLQKLFRSRLGTNNVDCCARVCHASTAQALGEMLGVGAATACYADIELARLIVVVGANPTEAHPVLGARIRQAVRRGARLVVIDPRRIELAECADVFLQLRPGSNVALLNALGALLLARGSVDLGYVAQRCSGLPELSASLGAERIEEGARISGVPVERLHAAAEAIAAAGSTLFVSGLGTSELVQGTASVRALCNLALLTGSIGRPGAGLLPLRGQNNVQGNADMGASPDYFTGYAPLASAGARARLGELWGALPPASPGARLPALLESARRGELRALWVQGEDLAQSEPDEKRVMEALARLDFLVVQELFSSETLEFAHLVLPAAGWLEQEGTFTNAERRIQRVRAAARAPGEARPDWEVIRDVANALGCGWRYPTPDRVMDEIARAAPALFGGVSYERLSGDGLQWPCPDPEHRGTERLHEAGFAAGRARLAPVRFEASPEGGAADFPYRLITGRVLHQYNVGSMTRRSGARSLAPDDFLEIHPDDAAREGVGDGEKVLVESAWGSATVRARTSARVAPGTLFLSFHYPDTHANRLVGPRRDPDSDCPDYKQTAVRLRV